jgi:3-isopropylmalate dehydrogenase
MHASIVMLPGDGVGPEIMKATQPVMDAVAAAFGHTFATQELLIGGAAIDAYGTPLRAEDLDACRAADGVLLGARGWDCTPISGLSRSCPPWSIPPR